MEEILPNMPQPPRLRARSSDLVAEADEDLMMKYLDGEEQLTQEELEGLFDKAIAQELFIPVFVGSTIIKQGIQGLMEDICTYFPHPTAHGAFRLADAAKSADQGRPAGRGLRVQNAVRPVCGPPELHQGVFLARSPGRRVINARTRKKERLGHVCIMKGKETIDVKGAMAGDIIVVPKLADTRTGDTLSHTGDIAIDLCRCPCRSIPWQSRPPIRRKRTSWARSLRAWPKTTPPSSSNVAKKPTRR
ncbi:MAG: EF-Tu/IF-2/RF-3 family GTPase [Eggerthellaceae bacterium]